MVPIPYRPSDHGVVDLRQTSFRKEDLSDRLVHSNGRCKHPRADVRHVSELEQSLKRAIFAIRSMG